MEKNEGYILIHRCMQDDRWLWGHKYSRMEIWLDMLLMARFADSPRTFTIRGNKVTINRGEFAESMESLACKWGWSRNSVIKILKEFEDNEKIEIDRSYVVTKVRIVNYDKYQNRTEKTDFAQQNEQQNSEQQKDAYLYRALEEIKQKLEQQNEQQFEQQNEQPYNNGNNVNISTSTTLRADDQKFLSELSRTDTDFFNLCCMSLNIDSEAYEALLQKFKNECAMREKIHWSMSDAKQHFINWSRGELERKQKQQANEPRTQNRCNNVGADANRNGYKGRGAYEPDPNCKYEGHFGD